LVNVINMKHELVLLAQKTDWVIVEESSLFINPVLEEQQSR